MLKRIIFRQEVIDHLNASSDRNLLNQTDMSYLHKGIYIRMKEKYLYLNFDQFSFLFLRLFPIQMCCGVVSLAFVAFH